MEPNETTGLIPLDDGTPTIEFKIPAADNSASGTGPENEVRDIPEEPETASPTAIFRVLRRAAALILTGITLITGGICLGHAAIGLRIDAAILPEFLLNTLSAGEVHAVPVLSDFRKATAADLPAFPLTPLNPEEEPAPVTAEETEIPRKIPAPLTLTNETPYSPDLTSIAKTERVIPPLRDLYEQYGSGTPVVLLLSTHATESYSEHAEEEYRTSDDSENVIRTASVIAGKLEASGIGVIHCRTRFDEEDFTLAYYNASLEIRRQLKEHPSIQYIIDVHRDSIQTEDGTYIAMESDGLARMMFVVGTDHGGSGHTGWEDNLALAARLHTALEQSTPGLMRPVNLRSASFNQQYTSGSLILEIGSCAGSLDSAVRSAELFAEILTDEIIG